MGWKSTVDITRKAAVAAVIENLDHVSDHDLACMLEQSYGYDTHPYNYVIVPEETVERYDNVPQHVRDRIFNEEYERRIQDDNAIRANMSD